MFKPLTSVPVYLLVFMFALLSVGSNYGAVYVEEVIDTKAFIVVDDSSPEKYKALALEYASKKEAALAVENILNYVSATADLSIINSHVFEEIQFSEEFVALKERYSPTFKSISLLYIFAAFLGFYIFLVLATRKRVDRLSTLFIGLFVLFHSVFILHLCLYVNNVQYYVPQSLFASTTVSFLYGPLLYFYFRRITSQYKMKWRDLLHLLPSVVLVFYILPYYTMSPLEKFRLILNQEGWLLPGANAIIVAKIVSLIAYAVLIFSLYKKKANTPKPASSAAAMWQRNIIAIFIVYVITYMIYGAVLTELITYGPMMNVQIITMVFLVFYVAYISYAQPEIFKGEVQIIDPRRLYNKYKKSGLTPSFSSELKDKLIELLDNDRVYRQSDINLEKLSEMMETTRHNASQVINEHFGLNFFELMNKYRIAEALEILKDNSKDLSIIQVAYEVGFNNKVTFNKSFKKHLSQTPSQYLLSLRS